MPRPDQNGPRCRICTHDDRQAIETAILANKSKLGIAKTFSLGSTNKKTGKFTPDHKLVTRHIEGCMSTNVKAAVGEERTASGLAIVSRLRRLDDVVDEILDAAMSKQPVTDATGLPLFDADGQPVTRSNHKLALDAVRQARANAELLAKLAGAAPEESAQAAEAARQALIDPEARRLLNDVEARLAETGE